MTDWVSLSWHSRLLGWSKNPIVILKLLSSDSQTSLCIRTLRGLARITFPFPPSSWFNRSEVRTVNFYFEQVSRWCWYYWSRDHPRRATVLVHFQSTLLVDSSTPTFSLNLQYLLVHFHSQLMITFVLSSPIEVKRLKENLLRLPLLHLLTYPLASVLTLPSWLFWKVFSEVFLEPVFSCMC